VIRSAAGRSRARTQGGPRLGMVAVSCHVKGDEWLRESRVMTHPFERRNQGGAPPNTWLVTGAASLTSHDRLRTPSRAALE
jgi:hypothetical protein